MMLHFPTYGVKRIQPGLRGFSGMGDGSDPCVNSDGTINDTCVQQQSLTEAQNLINLQDANNLDSYNICESNLAQNNAQRAGNGQPLLPDTCASQFPANANETVYTGYGNVQSGSGSPAGGTYYGEGTAPTSAYNPAPAYTAPAVSTAPVFNVTSGSNPLLGTPVTASPTVANPLLGTTNVPTSVSTGTGASTSSDLTIGGFDLTQNWMWVAGGVAALFIFMSMSGGHKH
jgi:hypothetical protein